MNKRYYFITSNEHKFREAEELFTEEGLGLEWLRRGYTEIQGDTLEEVVRAAVEALDVEGAFIEDSGLFVDALRGFPGVYSSYVLRTIGNQGILRLLEGMEDRGARFESVVGYRGGGRVKIFKGVVRGNISPGIRGREGFGYDPIFIPRGHTRTFAEDYSVKRKISHRVKSIKKLIRYLKEE
jgi:XTP/dITP diphosphohydrolase